MTFTQPPDDDPHLSPAQKKPRSSRKSPSGGGWKKWILPTLTLSLAAYVLFEIGISIFSHWQGVCFINCNNTNIAPSSDIRIQNNHNTHNHNTHNQFNQHNNTSNSDNSQHTTEHNTTIHYHDGDTRISTSTVLPPASPGNLTQPPPMPPDRPFYEPDRPAEPISNYPTNPTSSWNDAVPSGPARGGPDPRPDAPQYAAPTLPSIDAQPNFDTPEGNPPTTPEPIPTNEPNRTPGLPSIATHQGNPPEANYPGVDDTVPEPPATAGIIAIVSAIAWITKQLRPDSED